ncbi:hypothetical protein ORG37_18760 [Rahnella perminowiae]|uniref:hypothetical protein n=1 Tax=Rahnella perminowiae TaxID=2816244 RepID=UPI00224A5A65|nr:hypothetical protein [Rahnella perminowiae]MCX2945126.1 hypothetical protein [Rahnella perminowiae]
MIDKNKYSTLNINEACDYYTNQLGYIELQVISPMENRIFLSPDQNSIVRIGHDLGYDIYASSVMNGDLVLSNAVNIYDHYKVKRSGDVFYTITEMERLHELDGQDIEKLEAWRAKVEKRLNQPTGLCDPYSLLNDFVALNTFIFKYSHEKLGHDYLQSKNIMKRGEQFIIIDPFA